jgi:hypothetical protein
VSAIYWGIKKFGDEEIDLSHLRPFMFTVTSAKQPGRPISIVASFGFHTFTRKRRPGDPGRYFMGTANDPRTFCHERLACSRLLPGIIRGATNGRVKASDGNYLITDVIDGIEGEYTIAFKLEKSKQADDCARMFVVSAHPRPPLVGLKEIHFAKLAICVIDGLPIVPK